MEIGAVKQAFNNELILLKKNLNQARIQIIHKLTRKAKQLTEKKCPDALKEKLRRKAESAVKEVLIIKKIKTRDIGKFTITHTGKLQDYLNKPQVDNDKACARLLLHKALQEKYKFIRNRFSNIPIKDLFMSRQERLKLKKEEKQKKKDKKKGKNNNVVNAEGDWDVEEVGDNKVADDNSDDGALSDDGELSDDDSRPDLEIADSDVEGSLNDNPKADESSEIEEEIDGKASDEDDNVINNDQEGSEEEKPDFGKFIKIASPPVEKKVSTPVIREPPKITKNKQITEPKVNNKNKTEKRAKEGSKNKNLNEKIVNKKFKKDNDEMPVAETKIVDPFFITASGGNYMSVAEPRAPDEFKEEHRQGNRKLRRAVMFGHVPKSKPRQNFAQDNNKFARPDKFSRNNTFDKHDNSFDKNNRQFNSQNGYQRNNDNFNRITYNNDDRKPRFNDRNVRNQEEKPEKLHPSWEAKKKKSGILPFEGKKILFDDS